MTENLLHAYRHAIHALEDFYVLEGQMRHSETLMELYGELLHTISHHLRHAKYRIGHEL